LAWNDDATALVNVVALTTGVLAVSSYIETLLNDATAAEARTTLGAVGLTGNETIAGNKTFSGATNFSASAPTGFGVPLVKRKTAAESVTSSTTLQDDDDLLFSIGANEEWVASCHIEAGNLTNSGLSLAVTVPAGIGAGDLRFAVMPISAGSTEQMRDSTNLPATALSFPPAGFGALFGSFLIEIWIRNGANAGTVQLQWAQETSHGSATAVLAGGRLIAHRVA
jgi:hypothetical protein